MSNQKIDHIRKGDLVIVCWGWSKQWFPAVYLYAKIDNSNIISISFVKIKKNSDMVEHIRTRHSTYQRIYKITEDNLTKEQIQWYNDIKEKV